MSSIVERLRGYGIAACALLHLLPAVAGVAASPLQGPDLDLSIVYYSRILTAEGVLRESRYEETMLRRQDHVWVARVLPAHDQEDEGGIKKAIAAPHSHKQFNYVVLPRHVMRDGDKLRLEFVDAAEREVVAIAPAEYDNVDFDGSWNNAFFLIDPLNLAALPLSNRPSPVAGARWRERESKGIFQRVLWDEKKRIPLLIESGNRDGSFFRRIEVKPQASLRKALPWLDVKGYAQKEYADFLD